MKKLLWPVTTVVMVAVVSALVLRNGWLLDSGISRADCIEDLARFEVALNAVVAASPDLPSDQIVAQGLDRATRAESRFACEVGFGRTTRRDQAIDTIVIERYAGAAEARTVFETTEAGLVVESYSPDRPYRDSHNGPEVLVPVRGDDVTTFTSLHLIDCLIVRASWVRPLNDESLVEPIARDAWVRERTDSLTELCTPPDSALAPESLATYPGQGIPAIVEEANS